MDNNDLVPAREILRRFPQMPKHGLYRMVQMGIIKAYPQSPVPWRKRTMHAYSLAEVAAALGLPE